MPAPARFAALLTVLLLLMPGAARAGGALSDADRAAIRQVIESQLAAFQHDDEATAFSFASPFIQEKFGTPQVFMGMVKSGYPAVYRPKSVQFQDLDEASPLGIVQKVFLVGPDGQPVLALYEMQRQPDGSWKINGCILTHSPETSV